MSSFLTPTTRGIVRKRGRDDDHIDNRVIRRRGNEGGEVVTRRWYNDDRRRYGGNRGRLRSGGNRGRSNDDRGRVRYVDDRRQGKYVDNRSRRRRGKYVDNRRRQAPVTFERRRILRIRRDPTLFEEVNTANSTSISKLVYLKESQKHNTVSALYVIYRRYDQVIYRYKGVTAELWETIKSSDSLGTIISHVKEICTYTIVNHIPTMNDLDIILRQPDNRDVATQFYDYMQENRNSCTSAISEINLREIYLKWKNDNDIDCCNFSEMRDVLLFDGVVRNRGDHYTFDFMKTRTRDDKDILREEAEKDKEGLTVSSIFGLPGFVSTNTIVNAAITITNRGQNVITLINVKNTNNNVIISNYNGPVHITAGDRIGIEISFTSNEIGFNKDVIVLEFGDGYKTFVISRYMSINVGNPEIRTLLQASSNYKRPVRNRRPRVGQLIVDYNEGLKRPSQGGNGPSQGGGNGRPFINEIDCEVEQYHNEDICDIATVERLLESLPRNMTFRWAKLQHLCLYAEEIQSINDLDEFRMVNITITKLVDDRIKIIVLGLAESRPSVLVGDRISIEFDNRQHYGYVWEIQELSIIVSISNQLYNKVESNSSLVNINFELNSLPYRLMHQGIKRMHENKWINLIHPIYDLKVNDTFARITLKYNSNLNDEQMIAVKSIVESRSVRYIIFGPPGTGKTNLQQ